MENNTVFYFQLTMFWNIGYYKYPAFIFCLLLYGLNVFANLIIIVVTVREKTLHAPMYVFVACLSVNSLYGSSALFPRLLMDILSDVHLISHSACFTQIYVIYTYASGDLNILSVMAYDRYIAVCQPLHYHSIMNSKTVSILLVAAAVWPPFVMGTLIYLSSGLPLCGSDIQKVYCANWNVVKLSCIPTNLNDAVGMLLTTITIFVPFLYVLYTYLWILIVCWKSSPEFRVKVLHNCLPHIISFVIYSVLGFSDIALSRSNLEEISPLLAVILSLEFLVIPPVLNPLVYGLKLPEIRKRIERLFSNSVFPPKDLH